MNMNIYDRTWAQLNPSSNRPISRQPLGYISKQNWMVRMPKAAWLYLTTKYSLKISWHQAAR
jgi:hypothetical protein